MQRREPTFFQALISHSDETTKLEWVVDSDFRFFPVQKDKDFGYVLHPVDLAANKVMAAGGRREPRDIVDVVMIHDEILPLGAVIHFGNPARPISELRRVGAVFDVSKMDRPTLVTKNSDDAILETYQRSDGTITVPEVLRRYMGGLEVIGSR